MAVALGGDADAEFESWLSSKLKAYNTDESVLIPYVKGILEAEEEDDAEKREALLGIFSEISSIDVEELCQEVIKKWLFLKGAESSQAEATVGAENPEHEAHLEDRIAQIMLQQAESSVKKQSAASNHDSEVKQAILAQYSEVADVATDDEEEGDDDEDGEGATAGHLASAGAAPSKAQHEKGKDKDKEKPSSANLLVRNTNAETVAKAEKEKREIAKAEAEKKRQQDKLNREKQKQEAADRKDKEKKRTQKGERRR